MNPPDTTSTASSNSQRSLFLRLRDRIRETEEHLAELKEELQSAQSGFVGYKTAYDQTCTQLSQFRVLLRKSAPPADRPRQFVFMHIQKTAGITLSGFFGRQFDWAETLCAHSPREFDAYPASEFAHFNLVCGHMTARNLTAARPDALLCTFLREPIDRVLSAYWYFRNYSGTTRASIGPAVEAAKSSSLLEFVRDETPEVRMHVENHQAWALAADWEQPDDRSSAALLASALEGLDRFHHVGVTESLEDGVADLCQLTGWVPPAYLDRTNVTSSRSRVEDLTTEERSAIEEVTAVDAVVYRAARERAASRGLLALS